MAATFNLERPWLGAHAGMIAGVDEAGRGPLAGPVAAAAVILDPNNLPDGADDSKKLSAPARARLFDEILAGALAVGIGFGSLEEIERINIRAASLLAMRRALLALSIRPDCALIDGNALPDALLCPAQAIVKGDALCLSIAAASIVAKTARDRMMARLHKRFPPYGFDRNAGYGTASHLEALARHGPAECHRASFAPVRAALEQRR